MKVGTDGVLLGAWAAGGSQMLDIGTGTGLVALMMAQRFPEAHVTAVEVDAEAARQALENVGRSPFHQRITVVAREVGEWAAHEGRLQAFDAIVCNPPFFVHALRNPDARRAVARHADTLTFPLLMAVVARLLSPDGCFSLIIPADLTKTVCAEAEMVGLHLAEYCEVKTTDKKLPKRCLMRFVKQKVETAIHHVAVLESPPGARSEWYRSLTSDFYL